MQDVNRPANVEALSQPTRRRGPRVHVKSFSIVPCAEDLHGIGEHAWRRWDLGQKLAIRPSESERAVRLSIDLIALLMDGAVMPATE